MTRDEALLLPVGTVLVTPFEPVGRIRLVKVGTMSIVGEFLHDYRDHPKYSVARYLIIELRTAEQAEAGCKDGSGYVSHDVIGERCVKCGYEPTLAPVASPV